MKRTPLARKTSFRANSPMWHSRPKSTPVRQSAKGMPCTLRYPGCYPGPDNEQVVLCHLRQFGGGGMGMKPPDGEAVYGCMHCHDIEDHRTYPVVPFTPEYHWESIARALVETHRLQISAGILVYRRG